MGGEVRLKKAVAIVRRNASADSSKEYAGAVQGHAQVPKALPSVHPRDVELVLKWAAQRMSEGAMGRSLDRRRSERFPKELLEATKEKVGLIGQNHEGLSGNVYVHAAAYVSGKDDSGCAKGAAHLRTSGIKHVLKMDRCSGCIRNHQGSCSRYNKKLVSKVPVAGREAFQKAAIDAANHGDAVNVYSRGGTRVASQGIDSVNVNPVAEYDLFGTGIAAQDIEFSGRAAKPLSDDDVIFDESGGLFL